MIRKKLLFLSLLLMFSQQSAMLAQENTDSLEVNSEAINIADSIILKAYRYIGRPYRAGGRGPSSFDCSGFTQYLYKDFGYRLSNSSSTQAQDGVEVEGGYNALQRGDILIFKSRDRSRIGHVGLYICPDDDNPDNFKFIHAAVHGGVIVSNIFEPYYESRFVGARRILPTFILSDTSHIAQPIPVIDSPFKKKSIVRAVSSDNNSTTTKIGTNLKLREARQNQKDKKQTD